MSANYSTTLDHVSNRTGRIAQAGFKAHGRGLTRDEVRQLPLLPQRASTPVPCAPLYALFDLSYWWEPHTRRQMAALCTRCPLSQSCSARVI